MVSIANAIMDFEQKNYPYYLVSEVEIVSFDEHEISYRITICSKLDPKYRIQKSAKKIKISQIIQESRDNLIEEILKIN